jgi:hypothetical protein
MELMLVNEDGLSQKMKNALSDGSDIFYGNNLFQKYGELITA